MAVKAKKEKTKSIVWLSKDVDINLIDPTPNNYKIKTDLGKARLQNSLNKFGLAGSVVVNPNGKRYTLIDGNSRLEEGKERGLKKISISYPNKPLTPKEFKEMSAMFDFAVAGEVDTDRINQDLGTTADFFKQWGIELPMTMQKRVENMGKNKKVEAVVESKNGKEKKKEKIEEDIDLRIIQIMLTEKEEAEFRRIEDKICAKYKLQSTSQAVMKAFKLFSK